MNIYEVFFECLHCGKEIVWEYRTERQPLTPADLRPVLPSIELWCESSACRWRGWADELRMIRIVLVRWMEKS